MANDLQSTATIAVTVRYFAAARAAAGTEVETLHLQAETTVDELIDHLRTRSPDMTAVLDRCSFLCDEVAVRDRGLRLRTNQTVDVLPPFAGG